MSMNTKKSKQGGPGYMDKQEGKMPLDPWQPPSGAPPVAGYDPSAPKKNPSMGKKPGKSTGPNMIRTPRKQSWEPGS